MSEYGGDFVKSRESQGDEDGCGCGLDPEWLVVGDAGQVKC